MVLEISVTHFGSLWINFWLCLRFNYSWNSMTIFSNWYREMPVNIFLKTKNIWGWPIGDEDYHRICRENMWKNECWTLKNYSLCCDKYIPCPKFRGEIFPAVISLSWHFGQKWAFFITAHVNRVEWIFEVILVWTPALMAPLLKIKNGFKYTKKSFLSRWIYFWGCFLSNMNPNWSAEGRNVYYSMYKNCLSKKWGFL